MARIPDVLDLGPSPVPRRARGIVTERSGEIAADATGQFAGAIGNIAEQFGEREDKFAYAQAKSSLLQADIATRKELENDPDWRTYETRYQESMGKALEASTKQIRGNRDRALFEMDAKLDLERGLGQIRSHAKAKEIDWGRSTTDQTLEANRAAALNAPDDASRQALLMASKEAIIGAQQKGYFSEQEATNAFQRFRDSTVTGYVSMQSTQGQIDLLSNPKGTVAEYLQPDDRVNMLRQAQNQLRIEQERAEAERRAGLVETRMALSDQLRDITAAAQMGLPISVPSKAVLQAAFGEREGAQRHDLAAKAAGLSGDIASLQQLPTDDIVARVESYKPTQAEGAADQAQLYGMVASSANAIIKQRADDPAGFLTQFAPSTQAAWRAFQGQGDEATRDAYFRAVEADRERLGLPKGDILPNAYAKSLAEEIANPKSAEQLASLMEAEAQKWGDRWPDVHAQIAKDLPDMAAVIGSGIDRTAAVTLASTAKLKDSELQAMLPPSVKWGDVQADVAKKFDEVQRSFPVEGARTWQAIHDSAVRLAVSYMQSGANRDNAIDRAYKELIGNQYAIGEVKNVPFLVPRQFDAGDVEDEAQRLIDDFKPTPDMIAAPAGEDPARFIERATKKFREDAYWVARGDGGGLRLYMGARPTAISYSFDQITDSAAKRRTDKEAEVIRRQAEIAEDPRSTGGLR